MKDNFENRIFQMAEEEQIILPDSIKQKVDKKLENLPEHKTVFKMNIRKAIILAAVMIMLFSITATATIGVLRLRMEEMNQEKLEEYFVQIYTSKLPADNYNRPYMEEERSRMEELRKVYENGTTFPEGSITIIENADDYKGKNISFLSKTSTFFFPENEMSDEQLLQIIDFYYKRDYSLQKINEMISSGEIEIPRKIKDIQMQKEPVASAPIEDKAVMNPDQALTIPYTGELSLLYIAGGRDCIFLTGWNAIHKMKIGSSSSTLFFDDFDRLTRVTSLCQSDKGDIYLALMQISDSGSFEPALWVLNEEGKKIKEIDLSPFQKKKEITMGGVSGNCFIRQMVVDGNGYLYIKGAGFQDADILLILDADGNLVSKIHSGEYAANLSSGIGIGKDGKVYMCLYDRENRMGIASVNPEKGTFEDICMGIMPEKTILPDIIAPGLDSDFIFWGYDGIFSYNMREKSVCVVMPAYETPCDVEGALNCVLPDGRIVLVSCTEYTSRQMENGETLYDRIPDKTCFYYIPSQRKK